MVFWLVFSFLYLAFVGCPFFIWFGFYSAFLDPVLKRQDRDFKEFAVAKADTDGSDVKVCPSHAAVKVEVVKPALEEMN